MQIIKLRRRVTKTYYTRDFERAPGWGYSFPCDEHGNVLFEEMTPEAIENYEACATGRYSDMKDMGVRKNARTYYEPAVGKCDRCGAEVELVAEYCGACQCECGAWYNLFGQALNPPSMWEEPIDYDY